MTLACTIDAFGISAPSYADILASLQDSYRSIFGSDVYLAPDSQDGQLLALFASALNDANAQTIAVYNAFSPSTAQGAGLSSVVKINGLARLVPSNSTVDLTLVGVEGTTIIGGIVADSLGNRWALPSPTVIPDTGTIIVTAACQTPGAITASSGTVTEIATPTRGWQTATNVGAATPGAPVESDATLRQRQTISTALPAQTPLQSIVSAVANLSGVRRYRPYENDTGTTDANGIPGHTICLVVEGGDSVEIATTIANKKNPGTGTFGSTSEIVIDQSGVPDVIRFQRPSAVRIDCAITIHALTGYLSTTGEALKAAAAAYVSGLQIGHPVYLSKVETAAGLGNSSAADTFNLTVIQTARHGGSLGTADLAMAFDEAASLVVGDIALTVT